MKNFKVGLATLLAGALSFLPMRSEACTGARSMAMGHASVAACNDANAIYFNQGALPEIKKPEIIYTRRVGNDSLQRYDNIISLSYPITERLAIGFQAMDSIKGKAEIEKESWLKFGAGYILINEDNGNVIHSVGGALTFKDISLENKERGEKRTGSFFNEDITYLYQRKNALYSDDKFRAGVNVRILTGLNGTSTRVRPALSYNLPNKIPGLDDLTFAFEYYEFDKLFKRTFEDVDEDLGVEGPRFGLEQKIGLLSIRAGYRDTGEKKYSYGLGIDLGDWEINTAATTAGWGLVEIIYKF